MKKYFFGVCLLMLFFKLSIAQSETELNKLSLYYSPSKVINGPKWYKQNQAYLGHPFLKNEKTNHENIEYDNETYHTLSFKYDIHKQQLVVYKEVKKQGLIYTLHKSKIKSFQFFDNEQQTTRRFIRSDQFENAPTDAFLEVLHKNSPLFLEHHYKIIRPTNVTQYQGELTKRSQLYLCFNHRLYPIDKLKIFLAEFIENDELVRKYIKRNKLRPSAKNTADLTKVVLFCISNNLIPPIKN